MAKATAAQQEQVPQSNGEVSISAVEPPTVSRPGRKGEWDKPELLDRITEILNQGQWAGVGRDFKTHAAASKSVVSLKNSLEKNGNVDDKKLLRARIWQEGEGDDAPFVFALRVKSGDDE